MSEASREQRPLLSEDLSEEERFPEYPRRHRPMVYRGRARNVAKGAAAIISHWPDHWSASLTYWWMGLSIMCLVLFLVYNTLIAFVLLPPVQMKPIGPQTSNTEFNTTSNLPEIYMHVFANTAEEVDVNKYLPYIELLSNKNLDFNFNLIIVYNDTTNEANALSAEENNDIAFNALWDKEHSYTRKMNNRKNIKIKHVVLSHYMDDSPLKKNWRHIPAQFIEFLIKAISIWDKGGIAINPSILKPISSHRIYIDKIQSILHKYSTTPKESQLIEIKPKKHNKKHKDKYKKKVNNIRDIIDILEHEDTPNYNVDNLTEAEDRDNIVVYNGRKLLSLPITTDKNKTKPDFTNIDTARPESQTDIKNYELMYSDENIKYKSDHKTEDITNNIVVTNESYKNPQSSNSTSKYGLLPLFLEFLFHDKSEDLPKTHGEELGEISEKLRYRKNAIPLDKQEKTLLKSSTNKTKGKSNEMLRPMIIPVNEIAHDDFLNSNEHVDTKNKYETIEELTIDLKGNVLATKIPCHAFIGTMFSNVVHHSPEETLRDFIIVELSLFCKGLLTSCRGIDVILQ